MAPRKPQSTGSGALLWEVVGGTESGGVLVREGQDINSVQMSERLATGALVKQLRLEGGRLQYERLRGLGPASGWVSISLPNGKDLLVKVDSSASPATSAGAPSEPSKPSTAPPAPPVPAPTPSVKVAPASSPAGDSHAKGNSKATKTCVNCKAQASEGFVGSPDSADANNWYCSKCWEEWDKSEAAAYAASVAPSKPAPASQPPKAAASSPSIAPSKPAPAPPPPKARSHEVTPRPAKAVAGSSTSSASSSKAAPATPPPPASAKTTKCQECKLSVVEGAMGPADSEFAGKWYCGGCWRKWCGPEEAARILREAQKVGPAEAAEWDPLADPADAAPSPVLLGASTAAQRRQEEERKQNAAAKASAGKTALVPQSKAGGGRLGITPLNKLAGVLAKAGNKAPAGKAAGAIVPAVTCDRCGNACSGQHVSAGGKVFHPQCFKCKVCHKQINDDYSTQKDGFTCKNCQGGRGKCGACGKAITGESMTANGQYFHPRCFTCSVCSSPIKTEFFMHKESRVCVKCQTQLPPCAGCGNPIATERMQVEDKQYHLECFICETCGVQLKDYFRIQNRNVCKQCHNHKLPKCSACKQPIAAEYMQAMGQKFHPECCVGCKICGSMISGEFFLQNGFAICKGCSNKNVPKCAACRKPITGDSMNAEDKTYHPECWKCSMCRTKLKDLFVPFEGKHLCEVCYAKQAPKCAWCRQGVMGNGVNDADGNLYHTECFACSTCGQPIKDIYFPVQDHFICKTCYNGKAPKCAGCEKNIDGEYVVVDRRTYHHRCFKCSSCRCCIKGRFQMHGGQATCEKCHRSKARSVQAKSVGARRLTGQRAGRKDGPEAWATARMQQLRRELRDLRRSKPADRKKRLRGLQLELHPDKQPPENRKHAQPLFLLVQEEWEATKAEERGEKPKRSPEADTEVGETVTVVVEEEDWQHAREAWFGT